MKKIFSLLAAVAVVLSVLTACNNTQIPYRELAEAVKTANEKVEATGNPLVSQDPITYDEITNTVKFSVHFPGDVNHDLIEKDAENIKSGFLQAMVRNDEHDLCNPILNAKSNIIISLAGPSGKPFEILIENQELAQAKAALIEE